MPINLNISPRLIPNIASLYNDVNRIFLEYIDNSIDSAQIYYDQNNNSYSRPINIILKIQGQTYKDGKIIISDNCTGIHNFKKVVQSIGDSDKKAQPWTNGQFGYGIYSFMAACDRLEIISKTIKENAQYLPIEKSKFEAAKQEDVKFPDPKIVDFNFPCGTKICLCNFDKFSWKQINTLELKDEISKHFESLLNRKNLKIKIETPEGQFYSCKPYNYNDIEGEIFREIIGQLETSKGRKHPQKFIININPPIEFFLKLTKGKILNKPPIFIIKGRRIGDIKEIRAFRSNHKSDIWSHPNLTGYIDLGEFLEPIIARNDFKNNYKTKAVFTKLIDYEPKILEFIKEINQRSEDRHYRALEDFLDSALAKLAKKDLMKYRTEILEGEEINIQNDSIGLSLSEDAAGSEVKIISGGINNNGIGEKKGDGLGTDEGPGIIPGGPEGQGPSNIEEEDPYLDPEFHGIKRKRSGFNIKIVDREPDINIITNELERSRLVENTIEIFKKHPEFEDRMSLNRKGEQKITHRLITYLAGEITIHYKDKFHSRDGQPEYGKYLFSDLVNFIYRFENSLKELVDKNLSDL